MNISGINFALSALYAGLSSGKRINSAADDASGLAISQKITAQETLYRVQQNNLGDAQNLLNSTEGSLDTITSGIQRMRELAVRSANGVYTDSDRALLQMEVDQLKEEITRAAENTNFNGIKTLDGTYLNLDSAIPSYATVSYNASLDNLGIADFDLLNNPDIGALDSALNKIAGYRADIGGTSNAMDHNSNNLATMEMNLAAARSRIEDSNIATMMMQLQGNRLLQQISIYGQMQKRNNLRSAMSSLLGISV